MVEMTTLVNGGVSDGNGSKRSSGNGYHSNSGNAPKFKARKVSATRDFPPMCGQNFQFVESEAKEEVVVSVNDGVVTGDIAAGAAAVEPTDFKNKPTGEVVVSVSDGVVTGDIAAAAAVEPTDFEHKTTDEVVMSVGDGVVTGDIAAVEPSDFENKTTDEVVMSLSDGVVTGDIAAAAAAAGEPTGSKIRTTDEVVGSPIGEEGNESVDRLVERVVADFMHDMDEGLDQIVSDVKCMETESVKEPEQKNVDIEPSKERAFKDAQTSTNELGHGGAATLAKSVDKDGVEPSTEVGHLIHGEVATREVSVPSPKNKFRRRRISAIRDFPPYCGVPTSAPLKEEDKEITSGENSVGVNKVKEENAMEALTGGADSTLKEDEHVVVNALMASKNCPWKHDKVAAISGGLTIGEDANEVKPTWRGKQKAVAKKTSAKLYSSKPALKKINVPAHKHSVDTLGKGKSSSGSKVPRKHFSLGPSVDVALPPFGPSSSNGDDRNKVREILRLFQVLCRKLLQGEESRSKGDTKAKQLEKNRRIDIEASKIMKQKGKEVNTGQRFLGSVPGVEVGDEFQYRVELAIVAIHRLYQAGIDYMEYEGKKIATSIVASGGYDDDMENPDVLIYSGQGKVGKDKQPEDQKLVRGNLALFNSKSTKNPIRVIRGSKEKDSDSQDSKVKVVTKYVYCGLYTVESHWTETSDHGKLVHMFELRRIPGQPELAWKEVKKSKKARVRNEVCVADISGGEEPFQICAVNTIDREEPQPFRYIKRIMYPSTLHLRPAKGCDCISRCSDSRKCSCALRNGGQIPYNRNGAIVESKPLVYECGPHCKCPPSCYNRVTQHGIKIHLEIFKTESRGWGVRSLSSISSGSFICEYVGEILDDKEAEKRAGSDEYLFDIGQNYTDCSVTSDGSANSTKAEEEVGYTIDAANCGNVGRFINHSCSPNLYAQNVLYDHDDKRVPHIMLFAAENIPPLRELTYHYNYVVGEVYDSEGNVKVKSCYCGAPECTGRMY